MSDGNKWQPIETAPKDGTTIILFYPNFANGGRFSTVTIVNGQWDENKYAKNPRPFWENYHRCFGMKDMRNYSPTHWMPLPEPPTK